MHNAELQTSWNSFVAIHGPKSGAFLQSWEWGELQRDVGHTIYHFILRDETWSLLENEQNKKLNVKNQDGIFNFKNIDGVAQVIKMRLPFKKSYWYVPRGPIIKEGSGFRVQGLANNLKSISRQEGSIFSRIELPIEEKFLDLKTLHPTPCTLYPKSIQPQHTLILNLEQSEDELLRAMHEKTRYNIHLAERKGITVRQASPETTQTDIEKFWRLAETTAQRDNFSYHPKTYYEKMLVRAHKEGGDKNRLNIQLLLAEKNGETVAANIVTFFGKTVTYLHGASNYEKRGLMAPYLLQWRTMQEAKRLGFLYYDFWGIAPLQESGIGNQELGKGTHNSSHPWAGITRFKRGFGGEVLNYAPTVDFPISKFWYKLYRLAKKLV